MWWGRKDKVEYEVFPLGSDTGTPLTTQKRIGFVRKYVSLENKCILDAGCGADAYVAEFMKYSNKTFGCEYQLEKIKKYHSDTGNNNIVCGSVEDLCFPDKMFDLVFSNEVLEHINDDKAALNEMHRALNIDGLLFIFTPNRLYPLETHGCYTIKGKRIPSRFPFISYIPDRIAKHFLVFSNRNYFYGELSRKLENAGFDIIAYHPVWQTFSNSTGKQSKITKILSPIFRYIASTLERTPYINKFGISHLFICKIR
ncbi:MAG: class I SAM-dependent methyltransferase [Candidatus Heimdallarchaeota archaeon]|nr:class I SAM-dependent methyltransferase [Candidatus Heimdallarchaeota archaeon]